jgi:hypothetical protein
VTSLKASDELGEVLLTAIFVEHEIVLEACIRLLRIIVGAVAQPAGTKPHCRMP